MEVRGEPSTRPMATVDADAAGTLAFSMALELIDANHGELIRLSQALVRELPLINQRVLARLTRFLLKVSQHSQVRLSVLVDGWSSLARSSDSSLSCLVRAAKQDDGREPLDRVRSVLHLDERRLGYTYAHEHAMIAVCVCGVSHSHSHSLNAWLQRWTRFECRSWPRRLASRCSPRPCCDSATQSSRMP